MKRPAKIETAPKEGPAPRNSKVLLVVVVILYKCVVQVLYTSFEHLQTKLTDKEKVLRAQKKFWRLRKGSKGVKKL